MAAFMLSTVYGALSVVLSEIVVVAGLRWLFNDDDDGFSDDVVGLFLAVVRRLRKRLRCGLRRGHAPLCCGRLLREQPFRGMTRPGFSTVAICGFRANALCCV